MITYICLLRGINVSGKNCIKMNELKQIFLDLNFKNVITYIQSGNIVFQSEILKIDEIEQLIFNKIEQVFQFNVPVLIFNLSSFTDIIKENPFVPNPEIDITKLHVTLTNKTNNKFFSENNFTKAKHDLDEFKIINHCIYLYCPNGYGKTKLTNTFLRKR